MQNIKHSSTTACNETNSNFPIEIADIIPSSEFEVLPKNGLCTRRTLTKPLLAPRKSDFVQPIDINLGLTGDTIKAIPNMEQYPQRSLENAIRYIEELQTNNIGRVFLRIFDTEKLNETSDPKGALTRRYQTVKDIRASFPKSELEITVDPFNDALNVDGTWGVLRQGTLNYLDTATLFINIIDTAARGGADYVLTLGRIEHEVSLASRTLNKFGYDTKVASFSTNVETTNAYAYLPDKLAGRDTGQKILNGNISEMLLRSLIDIDTGSRFVIIKPAENTYVLNELSHLMQNASMLEMFLHSNEVSNLCGLNPILNEAVKKLLKTEEFLTKAADTKLGAYTVSGTYYNDRLLLERKGAEFTKEVLTERFTNLIASTHQLGIRRPSLIDRNSMWYLCASALEH